MRSSFHSASVAALAVLPLAFAVSPVARDVSAVASSAASATATPTLDPVLPPSGDLSSLDILNPSDNVSLYFGGSAAANLKKKRSESSYVLAAADFQFKYPSVALDHSNLIKSIHCSDDTSLAASFKASDVYDYAQEQWSGVSDLLFVTSAKTCGASANENLYFLASSVSFDETDYSFSASGSPVQPANISNVMNLNWGKTPASRLMKRSSTGLIYARENYTESFTIGIDGLLASYIDADPDAPWSNAVLLESWTSDDGTDSEDAEPPKTGESSSSSSFDGSVDLYCVDCGVSGSMELSGSIVVDYLIDFQSAEVRMYGNMYAGLFLGLVMEADFTEEYTYTIWNQVLDPWSITGIVSFGPYVSVGLTAGLDIAAQGDLLIGASATWPDIAVVMDLSSPSDSSSSGWTPQIAERAEANATLSVTASLGLPVSFGVELDVLDGTFDWSASLVDTPGVSAEAEYQYSSAGSTGCDGIEWSISLDNVVELDITDVFTTTLYDWSSTVAQSCISYAPSSAAATSTSTSSTPSSAAATTTSSSSSTPSTSKTTHKKHDKSASSTSSTTSATSTSSSSTSTTSTSSGKKHSKSTSSTTTTPTTSSSSTTSTSSSKKHGSTSTTTTSTSTSTSSTHTATPTLCVERSPSYPNWGSNCHMAGSGVTGKVDKINSPATVASHNSCAALCFEHSRCQSFGYTSASQQCQMYGVSFARLTSKVSNGGKGENPIAFANLACYEEAECKVTRVT